MLITRLESEKKNMITCIDKGSETIVGESSREKPNARQKLMCRVRGVWYGC